ncbi:MAG: hypothetical protein IKB05_00415 [Alphaproteobacteria bacterium]|nr:hypothetical protein [Alphaproteobacteria bacterium]
MIKDLIKEHNDLIDKAIKRNTVIYTNSSGKSENIVVHCYYIDSKKVSICVYAVKNKKTHAVSKYILKIKTDGNAQEITGNVAQTMYNTLSAKHEAQIARTQLKKNFHNRAFVRKR